MPNTSLRSNLLTFTIRRTLRIFPLYYLTLICLFIFDFQNSRQHWLPLTTYSWNYFCFNGGPFYLWSLSVEEQFYILWPFLVLFFRFYKNTLTAITIILITVSYSQIIFGIIPSLNSFNYTGLPNRMGSLCAGALTAICSIQHAMPRFVLRSKFIELLLALILLWCMACVRSNLSNPVGNIASFLSMAICSILLLCKCIRGQFAFQVTKVLFSSKHIQYLGTVSYGVYLIHAPLGTWFRNDIFGPLWHTIPFENLGLLEKIKWHSWVLSFPLVTLLSIGAATLSYIFIERPLTDFRNRFFSVKN